MASKLKLHQQTALSILRSSKLPISKSELASKLNQAVPIRTLGRWLSKWTKQGVVQMHGKGRATRYIYLINSDPESVSDIKLDQLGFLQSFDQSKQHVALSQLRDYWAHHVTAMRGNALSLVDTHYILEENLTIAGRSLNDHHEVDAYANAIKLLYGFLQQLLSEELIFNIHKAIHYKQDSGSSNPAGSWRLEVKGDYAVTRQGSQDYIEYALPLDVPKLMTELIETINIICKETITKDNAHCYYAKIHVGVVHINPFLNGNHSIASLLANFPILKSGLPPLVLSTHGQGRREYLQHLADYQTIIGQLSQTTGVWPDLSKLKPFELFCKTSYLGTQRLISDLMFNK